MASVERKGGRGRERETEREREREIYICIYMPTHIVEVCTGFRGLGHMLSNQHETPYRPFSKDRSLQTSFFVGRGHK